MCINTCYRNFFVLPSSSSQGLAREMDMAESEDTVRSMVQEVVRVYRDGLTMASSERPFLSEMAWFLVQATCLQRQLYVLLSFFFWLSPCFKDRDGMLAYLNHIPATTSLDYVFFLNLSLFSRNIFWSFMRKIFAIFLCSFFDSKKRFVTLRLLLMIPLLGSFITIKKIFIFFSPLQVLHS